MIRYIKYLTSKLRTRFKNVVTHTTHWSEHWELAQYRIQEITDDNGFERYNPQRLAYGSTNWKNIISFSRETFKKAKADIKSNKEYYRKEYNRHFTTKIKNINIPN